MPMSAELTTGVIAIVSAFFGALPGLISGYLARRADEKKELRELVLKTAAENWRFVAEASASKYLMPYEHYMIHTAMMCDLAFSEPPITVERTRVHLEKVDAVMKTLAQHAINVSSKQNAP